MRLRDINYDLIADLIILVAIMVWALCVFMGIGIGVENFMAWIDAKGGK